MKQSDLCIQSIMLVVTVRRINWPWEGLKTVVIQVVLGIQMTKKDLSYDNGSRNEAEKTYMRDIRR